MAKFSISRMCTPATLYFWISIISIAIMVLKKFKVMTTIVNLIFILIWTWFLNYLCSKGYQSISWFLVLLPFIIIALTMLKKYLK